MKIICFNIRYIYNLCTCLKIKLRNRKIYLNHLELLKQMRSKNIKKIIFNFFLLQISVLRSTLVCMHVKLAANIFCGGIHFERSFMLIFASISGVLWAQVKINIIFSYTFACESYHVSYRNV